MNRYEWDGYKHYDYQEDDILSGRSIEIRLNYYESQMKELKMVRKQLRMQEKLALQLAKSEGRWEELRQYIGHLYLNGKIECASSGLIYAKMKELEQDD